MYVKYVYNAHYKINVKHMNWAPYVKHMFQLSCVLKVYIEHIV